MRFLIMANGDYGDIEWYMSQPTEFDQVILVDGGANMARRMGIKADMVVGDMDSIDEVTHTHAVMEGTRLITVPSEKDDTDTQLAFKLAIDEGASEVVVWGGIGTRIDHSLSNLFSAVAMIERGIKVRFESPDAVIHLVDDRLALSGKSGDTVSLISLGAEAHGVSITGFKYPLNQAVLEGRWQYAISNVMLEDEGRVELTKGVLAVIHYRGYIA